MLIRKTIKTKREVENNVRVVTMTSTWWFLIFPIVRMDRIV